MSQKFDQNFTGMVISGVTGDGTNKTIAHGLGVAPVTVILTPYNASTAPYIVSIDATNVIVQGAAGTFDVTVLTPGATPQ